MDDDNGNGGAPSALGATGNPHISTELCAAYRETLNGEIVAMEEKLSFTIKLTVSVVGFILAVLQLGLHFFGG